ncbi:IS110 family transposase [Sporomusa sp.]|uniref:IS110 family transposase n=1 Tax=Sporomusa sp. TaxID=2078658 RepID=UPI002C6F2560|nr:IS110 family transposase [Sporomusa sp.]HWR08288.1 IS110 family transposase [Sporomusa sp.]
MLKIVYPICCGIDVHKTFVVATIAATDRENITTYKTKRFSTFTKDLRALVLWLSHNQCVQVCIESTGKYWIPVYNILEPSCRITLAHPKYVKAIRGKKTDKKDSIWIADLHKHGLVPGSFIPPADIREIRDLLRYRSKLVSFASSEKNRVQNSLTVSNIMLSNVVSDTFGKSASAILSHLLKHPDDQDFDFRPLLHGSMLKKQADIALAIDGTISEVQSGKISLCLSHMDAIKRYIAQIEATAMRLAAPYSDAIRIIQSLPGIRPFSALAIFSEIGADMSVFHSDKHLCSWAGLAPSNDQSAGKKKSVRISRAGVYIKPLLVQCANAAIKDKDFPYYRTRYEAIKHRRGHKRAIIAIARMMLTAIYHMLSANELFNPALYEKSQCKPGFVASSEQHAVKLLQRLGYSVVKIADSV